MTLLLPAFRRRSGAANMAFDALLLETIPRRAAAFRAYGWTGPVATFGFAQEYDKVRRCFPDDVTLCRRPTGGGIVDHRHDWTYCLALGAELAAARQPAPAFYCFLHETVGACLRHLGAEVSLAHCPEDTPSTRHPDDPSQCFAAPAPSDLIRRDGRKVAGAALRRTRRGLLAQGSVDRTGLPPGFDFTGLENACAHAFSAAFGLEPSLPGAGENLIDPVRLQAEADRFASPEWNRRR